MSKQPDVSIIIVNWNSLQDTLNCIASIYRWTAGLRHQIIVVDNASTTEQPEMIREKYPEVELILSAENLGFAAGNNLALAKAVGRYVLFLNPDTILKNNAIGNLVSFLDGHPEAGICGGRLFNQDGTLGISYGNFPTAWHVIYRVFGVRRLVPKSRRPIYGQAFDPNVSNAAIVDWVSGANLCIRQAIVQQCRGFDVSYFFSFDDVDLCYRARQLGHKTYFVPSAEIFHLRSNSFKTSPRWFRIYFYTSEFVFFKKHHNHANWIYVLNMVQWSLKYLKRSFRKKHKRGDYATLIKNIRAIQKGQSLN
jgi:hypothetical protein